MKCCNAVLDISAALRDARNLESFMSQQLTISSLFAALALVTLAMFARAGELAVHSDATGSLVSYQAQAGSDA